MSRSSRIIADRKAAPPLHLNPAQKADLAVKAITEEVVPQLATHQAALAQVAAILEVQAGQIAILEGLVTKLLAHNGLDSTLPEGAARDAAVAAAHAAPEPAEGADGDE